MTATIRVPSSKGLTALVLLSAAVGVGAQGTAAYTELAALGAYHDPAGLIEFPVEFESWKRGRILRYEQLPGGVSIEYEFFREGSVEHRGMATAYVYPRRGNLDAEAHLEETVAALLAARPTFELVSAEAAEFGRGKMVISGRMATLIDRGASWASPRPVSRTWSSALKAITG